MGDTQQVRFTGGPGWPLNGALLELPDHIDPAAAQIRVTPGGAVVVDSRPIPAARVLELPVAMRPAPVSGQRVTRRRRSVPR